MLTKHYAPCLCLLLVLAISACHKSDKEPESDGTILSRIVYHDYTQFTGAKGDTANAFYSYNTNGSLASIITVSRSLTDSTLFVYNSQGQLTDVFSGLSSAGGVADYQFVYDVQGRIVRKTGIPILQNLAINDHTYAYDEQNRVITDSIHNGKSSQVLYFTVYEYNNGNITKASNYSNATGTPVLQPDYPFTYDNRLNPYYALRSVLYFAWDSPNVLSQNNNISTDVNASYKSTYSYYSNGLIRNIVSRSSTSEDYYTTDFFYKK